MKRFLIELLVGLLDNLFVVAIIAAPIAGIIILTKLFPGLWWLPSAIIFGGIGFLAGVVAERGGYLPKPKRRSDE